MNGNVIYIAGKDETVPMFDNRNAARRGTADRCVHVIQDIFKDDCLKKPQFVCS